MAVTAFYFGKHFEGQYSATAARRIDFVTDTIKVALTTSTYAPNQDTHDFFDDVTNEITGTGYTAGGATLATKTVGFDATSNENRLDAADAVWTTASFTARRAVIYKDTGTASTSPLICWLDFGADNTVSAGTFTLQWASNGVAIVTVA